MFIYFASFLAGIIFQVGRHLQTKAEFRRLFLSALAATACFLPSRNERVYVLDEHASLYFIFLPFVIFAFLKHKLLPPITDTVLLTYNLVIIFVIMSLNKQIINLPFTLFLLISSFVSLLLILLLPKMNKAIEMILYIWFLISSIVLLLFQAGSGSLPIFFNNDYAQYSLGAMFLSGMLYATLSIRACGLLLLIPLPGKRQSLSDRIRQVKQLLHLMAEKYDETHTNTLLLFGVGILTLASLLLNYRYEWISNPAAVATVIIFVPELSQGLAKIMRRV